MRAILLPIKSFSEAKRRLEDHFAPEARAELAAALCYDLFETISRIQCVHRVIVVSNETQALSWARRKGWETIRETHQSSESDSVDKAAHRAQMLGIDAMLRLPADIPLLSPYDIPPLFNVLGRGAFAVIVPSHDGTGTNALLRSPPTIFRSRFGPCSLGKHLEEAKRAGAQVRIRHNHRIAHDLDTIEDLEMLRILVRRGSQTARWCEKHAETAFTH